MMIVANAQRKTKKKLIEKKLESTFVRNVKLGTQQAKLVC
jgi:hypothetical protein